MEEKKVSKKKKGNAKKIVGGILGVGLIVGVTIVGTLAFLDTTTETVTNTFTASSDIKLGLAEPNYNYDTENKRVIDETLPNPKNYQPGETYAKDPTLYNWTGGTEGSQEWVAMRVDYSITDTSKTPSKQAVTYTQLTTSTASEGYNSKIGLMKPITFDAVDITETDVDKSAKNWIRLSDAAICSLSGDAANTTYNYEIYVYKYKLTEQEGRDTADECKNLAESTGSGGIKTTPLFEEIEIKDKDTLLDTGGYKNTSGLLELPEFIIELKGAAVKDDATVVDNGSDTENIDDDSDYDTIKASEITTEDTNAYNIVQALVKLLH